METKHIIWDWNGTLLDDIDVSMEALNYVLNKHHLPLVEDKEEYRRYFQFPIKEYYKKVGFDFTKTPFPILAQEYMSYYQPHSLKCNLHKGVMDVLKEMQDKGVLQHLLSASNINFLKQQLAIYHIEDYFMDICGLDNIHAHSKAELAKEFVQESPFTCESVVFVGDSVHDFEVAQGAGCRCILIANGHEHRDKLLACGCSLIDQIQEINKVLI